MIIEFLRNPKNTGTIIPSSRFLVNEMISHVSKEDTLIELGAGTGVITKRLALIESVKIIYTYENNNIYHNKLKNIDKTICLYDLFSMREQHRNEKIKTIISSIPFVNFSIKSRNQALSDISKVLDDDGLFIQYTYRNQCPFGKEYLYQNNLKIKNIKKVWLNIPPATVFVYEKIN